MPNLKMSLASGLPTASGDGANELTVGSSRRLSATCGCTSGSQPPRRSFLSGLLALGAGAALPGCGTPNGSAALRDRIDTHHHLFSPAYVAELADRKSTV